MGRRLGRYRIVSELARGGMATVWIAEADGPGGFKKRIVLKTMLRSLAHDRRYVRMFIEEAANAARLEHDNIVRVFDFGEVEGEYFIAMEHVPGRSLRQIRARYFELERRPERWVVLRAVLGMCDALQYVHDFSEDGLHLALLHRDVSPDNVLVSFTGSVKLLDFGVAHTAASATTSGLVVGKYRYMAPERLDGSPGGPWSDVYSAGVMLYELLSGVQPFEGASLPEIVKSILRGPAPLAEIAPWVPPALAGIVGAAMAVEPSFRYDSADRFARDLRDFAGETDHETFSRSLSRHMVGLFAGAEDLPSSVRSVAPPNGGRTSRAVPSHVAALGAALTDGGLELTTATAAEAAPGPAAADGLAFLGGMVGSGRNGR